MLNIRKLKMSLPVLTLSGVIAFSPGVCAEEEEGYAQTPDQILTVDNSVTAAEFTNKETDPVVYEDNLNASAPSKSYAFIPPADGDYVIYFDFSAGNAGINYSVTDSYGNSSASGYRWEYGTNAETVSMTANITYTIDMGPYNDSGYSKFSITIYSPKKAADITDFTEVHDRVTYQGERNAYTFTPSISGQYNFYLSDVTSNISLTCKVCDPFSNEISDNGVASLTAGETYSIYVSQEDGLGRYTLNIGRQKDIATIEGYTAVKDSFAFEHQINYYSFTAPADGTYAFTLTPSRSGQFLIYGLYDVASNELFRKYDDTEMTGTADLTGGTMYALSVLEPDDYSSLGDYTLQIRYPVRAAGFLNSFVPAPPSTEAVSENETEDPEMAELRRQNEQLQSELDSLKAQPGETSTEG